ncbi:stress response translation initiation inhibitor YciH [archaeon CG10_big_fil_rev_8_21_14_0_10_43_11]|nr:MAG: stress response translation initiation inhibitor YciH [archaeon CG10_big_fil_rev_8_21_14_0_10_43_11]
MSKICSNCGFPEDLCVCESLAKEQQKIRVRVEKRRYRKDYTLVEGFDEKSIDVKSVAKQLKNKLACGGTFKNGIVELQGNHRDKIQPVLVALGFPEESIDVL